MECSSFYRQPQGRDSQRLGLTVAAMLVLLVLPACAAIPEGQDRQIESLLAQTGRQHGLRPDLPTPKDIHKLSAQQRQHFLNYFHSAAMASYPPPRRLYYYLRDREAGFEYRTETLIASEALSLNSGNCLILAIETTALAQLVGLEMGWQTAE